MPPEPLPILQAADAIRTAVRDHRRLVLVAPPGTGKSTQVPQLLWPGSGEAVVLQPRRIAARNLAGRVASEREEALGEGVGYQVRFERARSAATRVLFTTYGTFWQRILEDPRLGGVELVVLDEFHERTLEADACLAWVRHLQRRDRPDLALVVMSATLEGDALAAWLEAPVVRVEAAVHPVAIHHQAPQPGEPLPRQAARAFRHLQATGERGSVLVFMPGVGEVRRTVEALAPDARTAGYEVLELSGAQPPDQQQRALSRPAERPCVVVATNVAETSLTIPGVTAVVDSGLSRQAAYDPDRDLDTLHLAPISRQNATQRAGRAGRLAPGTCLRLWPASHDAGMREALPPEVERLDLARLALACATLPGGRDLAWFSPPPGARLAAARARLQALGALGPDGGATPLGRRILRLPVAPALARVLLEARDAGCGAIACAMVAIVEAAEPRELADEGDLYLLARDLLAGGRFSREVRETHRQLERLLRPEGAERPEDAGGRERITRCWLSAFGDRLAARQEVAHRLADGRKGLVLNGAPPDLLLALALHEVGGAGTARQITIPLYLPVEAAWLDGQGEPEVAVAWDSHRQRVVRERRWVLSGIVLRAEPLAPGAGGDEAAEELLVAKVQAGEAPFPARTDPEVEQLERRVRLAAATWPGQGYPALDADDWRLLLHELARGRSSLADVPPSEVVELLREYVGWTLMDRLDRAAPRSVALPGGRRAKILIGEDGVPELSARLGDLLGFRGDLTYFEGRVPVRFDLLAPNFRTVQKTFDLAGFWTRTYPEVRKELRRRYPKHPWPENP